MFQFIALIVLPYILYSLKKFKIRILKYLFPLASLVDSIIFYLQMKNSKCTGYELDCLGNFGSTLMIWISCFVFVLSLIICIIIDLNYNKQKNDGKKR